MNILLTSAGGPAAIGVIKSLIDIRFQGKIVVTDVNSLSAGFHFADKHYITPYSSSEDEYISTILNIVAREKIDLILPTGADIRPITKNIDLFTDTITLFMSDHDSIMRCNDKFLFYVSCKDHFPLPVTSTNHNTLEFPCFCKPRIEQGGSRGAKICNDISDIDYECDYIYQEILPGQEYTIDVLCDMESNPLVIIPRMRLQIKAGISSKGRIIRNEYIERQCYNICKFLKLKGPICLQMKEDKNGIPKFIEINPRFGGSTYFTTLAGVNFCKLILDIVEGKEDICVPTPEPITILRYYEEVCLYE